MRLIDHLSPSRVVRLESTTKKDVLRELVAAAASSKEVRDERGLLEAIYEREGILSTGIGLGIAVPHAKIETVDDFVVCVGVSPAGVDFDALDQSPAHVVVLIAAPVGRQRDYLGLLAQVTVTLKDEDVRRRIIEAAEDPARVHELLASAVH
jgi:mannitol/fructose-specific phosphotransferase system IIA component (Ntr-type)